MKIKIAIFLFLITNFPLTSNAQNFDLESYNKEKQQILNIIINTPQFDTLFGSNKLYIVENELLSKNSSILIKRKQTKAIILDKEELERTKKVYIGIGDFTMNRSQPTKARVQIFTSLSNHLLNFSLEKKEGVWIIVNSVIIDG